jgi:hypothetical protein
MKYRNTLSFNLINCNLCWKKYRREWELNQPKMSYVVQKKKPFLASILKRNSYSFRNVFVWHVTTSYSLIVILLSSITIQNSEVNNVQNKIIIQRTITKSSVGQHGPPTNAKVHVGTGAIEE